MATGGDSDDAIAHISMSPLRTQKQGETGSVRERGRGGTRDVGESYCIVKDKCHRQTKR